MKKCNNLIKDIKVDLFLDKLLEAVRFTTILNCKIEDSELKESFLMKYFTIYNFSYDEYFAKFDYENIVATNVENRNEFLNDMSFADYKITKEKYSHTFFKEIHLKLFKGSRFDKNGCLIGEYENCPSNEIKESMEDLISFINDDNLKINDLVKCAIFLFQFHRIKPFEKGNEKLIRNLIPIYLYKANIFNLPIFGMSYIFLMDKIKYLNFLENIEKIDINDWISFFLEKCIDQAKNNIKLIQTFINHYEICKDIIVSKFNCIVSEQLIDIIFGKVCFTSNELAESMNISNTQANRYLRFLVKAEILATDSKQRYKKYYIKGLEGILNYY